VKSTLLTIMILIYKFCFKSTIPGIFRPCRTIPNNGGEIRVWGSVIAFALPSSPKSGLDIAAVPSDDATDWVTIQYGAQWPVCRSWCQCHPLPTVLFLWPGVCNLDPGVPGKSPRYPPSALSCLCVSDSSDAIADNLTITFARIAAISSPLMNAVAHRNLEAEDGIGFRRVSPWVPWESRAARPGFASGCNCHVMTFFRSGCGKLGAHLILWILPMQLHFAPVNQKFSKRESVLHNIVTITAFLYMTVAQKKKGRRERNREHNILYNLLIYICLIKCNTVLIIYDKLKAKFK